MLAGVYAALMTTPEPVFDREWVCKMFEVPVHVCFELKLIWPDCRGCFVKGV